MIKTGFTQWKKNGVRFFTIPAFERAGGVVCAFSTRIGGVSPPPYDTLNFSREREQMSKFPGEHAGVIAGAVGFNSSFAVPWTDYRALQ